MRRFVISLLMACSALGLFAQSYHVSTQVQKKHALVEEFTGVRCPNCPEGHRQAASLIKAFGENVSVVAIHCGGYAIQDNGIYDLTVPDGKGIGNLLGGSGGFFPNCIINRRDWEQNGKLYENVNKMKSCSEQIMQEDAPVNLWAKAEINGETSEMEITVEGYFTADLKGITPYLNLYIVQNKVLNVQLGTSMGDKYEHNHLLRDAITGVQGEALGEKQKGDYFVKTFVYQLPESYKKIPVNLDNIELIVFVSQGSREVLNTLNVHPTYKVLPRPLGASLHHSKPEITGGYRYDFVKFVLQNECDMLLTSATFDVQLNGVAVEKAWKGEIGGGKSAEIRLEVDWNEQAKDKNVYQIMLKTLNGKEVEHKAFSGVFYAPDMVPAHLLLEFNTDMHAGENTYRLCNMSGEVLKTFGPYPDRKAQKYEEKLDLQPDTRYCLEVLDAKGNGIVPDTGMAIVIKDEAGKVLISRKKIYSYGFRFFLQTQVPAGIDKVAAGNEEVPAVYDGNGRKVGTSLHLNRLPKGVYILRSAKESKKILVN